jgi:hypothetical protein
MIRISLTNRLKRSKYIYTSYINIYNHFFFANFFSHWNTYLGATYKDYNKLHDKNKCDLVVVVAIRGQNCVLVLLRSIEFETLRIM